jgi:hypothetical protein
MDYIPNTSSHFYTWRFLVQNYTNQRQIKNGGSIKLQILHFILTKRSRNIWIEKETYVFL